MPHPGPESFTLTLPSDTEILIQRVFRIPRERLFDVLTRPEHLRHWWGPRAMVLIHTEMDVRPGGRFRHVLRGPDGGEYAFRGEYREVSPPERVVSTFEFEGLPGHVSVETLTLIETAGLTTLSVLSQYSSREDRDGHLHSGMERGARESHDRLEELLAELF